MKQLIVFLDANVLYSAGLRDLFMRLALQGFFHIRWSNQVHEEWLSNLLANRPDLSREKLERTRRLMLESAPDSLVENYEAQIENITLPDPDDRHVVAAAIAGKASIIVTFNLSDFPKGELTNCMASRPKRPTNFLQPLWGCGVTSITAEPRAICVPGGKFSALKSRSINS